MAKGSRVIAWLLIYGTIGWLLAQRGVPVPQLFERDMVVALTRPFQRERVMPPPLPQTYPTDELATLLALPPPSPDDESPVEPVHGSWQSFLWQLRELRDGERDKVRVIHLGDSELVADGTSSAIREELSKRFGFGGHGFSLAMQPLPWYQREHWRHRKGRGFTVYSYPHGQLDDGEYGPGGVAFDGPPGSRAWVSARHPHDGGCTLQFYYAYRGRGGAVRLYADGKVIGQIDTDRWRHGIGRYEQRFASCPSDLEVLTEQASTRIYGWSIEYDQPGIVWSSLGVISAQLPQLAHYDENHLRESLSALEPDLVVFTFGLNLAAARWPPGTEYRDQAERMMTRVRNATGGAPCLVTSPYPVGYPSEKGYNPESNAAQVLTEFQREAAERVGCVFIDRFRLSGGVTAARRWVAAHPKILSGDYQHLTLEGGRRMGRAIAGVILASFANQRRDHRVDFALERQSKEAL